MEITTNFKTIKKVLYDENKDQISGEIFGFKFFMDTKDLPNPFPQLSQEEKDEVFGQIESQVESFIRNGLQYGELFAEVDNGNDEDGEPITIELGGWFE